MAEDPRRVIPAAWNHNIHYHPIVLEVVPDRCERALDVGCGEGLLARELCRVVRQVSAIDCDKPSLDLARQHDVASDIEYLLGDFLTYPFEPASLNVITSVAALHHMDAAAALGRMRELLRPGGTLVVVGLARSRYPADLPRDTAAALANLAHKATKGYWEHRPRRSGRRPRLTPPYDASPKRCFPEFATGATCCGATPSSGPNRHLRWRPPKGK